MRNPGNIPIQTVHQIEPPPVQKAVISNGVPMYYMSGSHEPVLHLELIFSAGKGHERQRAAAHATAALLSEGTGDLTSHAISEQMEYYGATLRANTGVDALSISLYCMSRMFKPAVDLLTKLLVEATFPESELAIYKQNRIQKIRIAMEQNETIANRLLSRAMFGAHVYGQTTEGSDVAQLTRSHILDHYALLGTDNMSVFLSGQVEDTHLRTLEEACTTLNKGFPVLSYGVPPDQEAHVETAAGPQKFQSAIRMGRQIISRRHPDFPAVFMLNTILGGFFGARLMKNLREEKGLTYGIYSTIETLVNSACLIISTEAAVDKTDRVISEIHREITRLQHDLVPDEELEMVRNYLMGTLLMQLDGPLRSMEMIKTMIMESLDDQYFRDFVRSIHQTRPEDIRAAAQHYLGQSDLHRVVVGQQSNHA